jgi:hypothetical protein
VKRFYSSRTSEGATDTYSGCIVRGLCIKFSHDGTFGEKDLYWHSEESSFFKARNLLGALLGSRTDTTRKAHM